MLSLGLKITMGVIMAIQLLAIGYAAHLVLRTKYSVIWILCILCFVTSFAQHCIYIFSEDPVDFKLFIAFDLILSACLAIAVLFANRLVNYIDRLNYQRNLLSKRLLSTVLRTEERSRSQFAKELHDGMGPLLSSAKMSLSAISTENMSDHQKEILQNTRFVIDEAIRSVREISNNMSPQVLMDFGLAQGIRNFISRIKSLHTIEEISFETNLYEDRFDNDVEVVLYRVVCELINNSLKHSHCSKIEVVLMLNGSTLELKYSDNGCGFDPNSANLKGMGMSNITSRIDSLNGVFSITSSKGKGMKALVYISTKQEEPLSKQRRRNGKRNKNRIS
jgi:signal transduction histidine kinase